MIEQQPKARYLTQHEELNGGVGATQLKWLSAVLTFAQQHDRCVVVLSHAPFTPKASRYGDAACWNSDQVRALLNAFAPQVVAVVAGHDHFGGEWLDPSSSIPHVVMEAAVIGAVGLPAHGFLHFQRSAEGEAAKSWKRKHLEALVLEGCGAVTSRQLFPFQKQ